MIYNCIYSSYSFIDTIDRKLISQINVVLSLSLQLCYYIHRLVDHLEIIISTLTCNIYLPEILIYLMDILCNII